MSERKKENRCEMRRMKENAYFVASNSSGGFQSYYTDCFDRPEIERVFAIKGGPGTGKSRFMREVAECGAEHGWQADMIYCSSDPNSLDGVVLMKAGQGIALLDATAPHVYEPRDPGFRGELINLGMFWNAELLRKQSGELRALNHRKSQAYRRAYRYLSAYGAMEHTRRELVTPFYRTDAISAFAEHLLQHVPNGEGFHAEVALMRSVGMHGVVGFDTYFTQAKKIFLAEDCRGSASVLLAELYRCAMKKGLHVRVSKDPILSEQIDGLFLCDCGYAFAVSPAVHCELPCRHLSMRRFVSTANMHACRKQINYAERMRDAMLGGALEALDEVRRIHFQIEQIYIATMDFSAKEAFTADFCKRLFHTNESGL